MNVIARLEYELAYYDSAVHRLNHYTTRTPPHLLCLHMSMFMPICWFVVAFFFVCVSVCFFVGVRVSTWFAHVCVHVSFLFVCMCTFVFVNACMCVYASFVWVCVCVCVFMCCVCTCLFVFVCDLCVCACVCVCVSVSVSIVELCARVVLSLNFVRVCICFVCVFVLCV